MAHTPFDGTELLELVTRSFALLIFRIEDLIQDLLALLLKLIEPLSVVRNEGQITRKKSKTLSDEKVKIIVKNQKYKLSQIKSPQSTTKWWNYQLVDESKTSQELKI